MRRTLIAPDDLHGELRQVGGLRNTDRQRGLASLLPRFPRFGVMALGDVDQLGERVLSAGDEPHAVLTCGVGLLFVGGAVACGWAWARPEAAAAPRLRAMPRATLARSPNLPEGSRPFQDLPARA